MKILGVHHSQLTIPGGEEENARRFYCDFLGLEEVEKPAALLLRGGFWLQVGEFQIHVGIEDGFDRHATKAHLAYEVDDLEKWRQHLAESGTQILESVAIPDCVRFEFRDPFGNRIEFLQKTGGITLSGSN